jgi:small subunit ribosomal protein S4
MKSQPTYKVCRRLGAGVFDKCQTQKYTASEAKHSKNARGGKRKNVSDFGKQLLEKQKVRFSYGISERQLRKYIDDANRVAVLGGDSKLRMLEQLEMRLDNVVYKLGFAQTRRAARQMVSHGHLTLNGIRTTIPSRQVKEGDVITVRERTRKLPIMDRIKENVLEASTPTWMTLNGKEYEGKITARPTIENTEMPGSVAAILEYYSR